MAAIDVRASITYLAHHESYQTEKPFNITCSIDHIPEAKSTNHVFDRREMLVQDVRGRPTPDLDQAGFTLLNAPTALQPVDFDSPDLVQTRYFREIEKLILDTFPQYSSIMYLDHELRKRDVAFPEQDGKVTRFAQPLPLAHLDLTPKACRERLRGALDDESYRLSEEQAWDQLNIWRVLRGPNNDWPLALCDFRSVEPGRDPILNDVIYAHEVSESYLLHPNEKHEWHYVSDQEVEDVVVFRNTASEGRKVPSMPSLQNAFQTPADFVADAWHAAFRSPRTQPTTARESIEVKVVAFLKTGS
ncbi:MAG: hypothetical protein M1817_004548 [Caeruleum heppii]|nr:MAG: hypothetical protein M1817_004548 [Caeruleum heppii]